MKRLLVAFSAGVGLDAALVAYATRPEKRGSLPIAALVGTFMACTYPLVWAYEAGIRLGQEGT